MKRIFLFIFLLSFTAFLIIFPQNAKEAAAEGVKTCIMVIIPSLFPFLVVSGMIISSGAADLLGKFFTPVFRILFGINGVFATAVILGFIAGFPIGADCAYRLYKDGKCSKEEAEYLLSFCSNTGISFISGVLGGAVFKSFKIGIMLYCIQIVSSILTGIILKRKKMPAKPLQQLSHPENSSLITSVKNSVVNIAFICGYIIIFSVLTKMLTTILPSHFSIVIKGLFELSSAVLELKHYPLKTALIIASGMLSWAGICVHMQIRAVTGKLSLKFYFIGKLIHMALSMLMTFLIPIEEQISVYNEIVAYTYRRTDCSILFILIIFIVLCCIFFRNNVK